MISAELQAQQLTTILQMFLCPLANIVGIFRHGNKFQNQRPKTFVLFLRTRQGQGPGLTSLCILPLHSPRCSLPRDTGEAYFFTQVECLRFLPIANKLTAPKLMQLLQCKPQQYFFSPDIVTFAILLKEVGFMGRATSREWHDNLTLVSYLSPPVVWGPCSGIWYGPDLSETWSQYMSGRVRSGLVCVRVVEFGL